MNNEIGLGDIVKVDFNNAKLTLCGNAEVLHIPNATGDSWVFQENLDVGQPDILELYYVSEGCTITLIRKKS